MIDSEEIKNNLIYMEKNYKLQKDFLNLLNQIETKTIANSVAKMVFKIRIAKEGKFCKINCGYHQKEIQKFRFYRFY